MRLRFRARSRVAFAAAACLVAATTLLAQVTTARLEGFVRDPSDAVIPGVNVVALNERTQISHDALTNESGLYVFAKLPPGRYTVTAELPGFKRYQTTSVVLEVGDTRSLQIKLETGELAETITVAAEVATVDTVSNSVGSVVNSKQIEQLPLVSRNPLDLFFLQPGTNRFQTGNARNDGLRDQSSNVTVEGIGATEPGLGAGATSSAAPVPIEAVGEYRVVTSSAEAEYGRGAGAQVQIIYRSGTNQFHGSAFDFHRNKVLNANTFFGNKQGLARPTFLRNQFGGSVGGPIIRNKFFFHFTYEGVRQKTENLVNELVYTPTLKNGLFRYYNKGANSVTLVDQQGNPRVPASDISTIDLLNVDPTRRGKDPTGNFDNLVGSFAAPNNFDIGDGFNTGGFRYLSNNPLVQDLWVTKLDYHLTSKHVLSASIANRHLDNPGNMLLNGTRSTTSFEAFPTAIFALNSSFTSTWLNELRLGGTKRDAAIENGDPDRLQREGVILFVGLADNNVPQRGHPKSFYLPQFFKHAALTVADNATWIRGNHSFRGGMEVRINRINVSFGGDDWIPVIDTRNPSNPANIPALPDLATADRSRAAQFTNDLTGSVGRIEQHYNANSKTSFSPFDTKYRLWRSREYGFFFQDTWKVRQNLTVNLGVRYELMPPHFEAQGLYSYPIGGTNGLYGISGGAPTQLGLAPEDGKVYATDKNNFGPNVGFNWDPGSSGKWSISGNYRISYDKTWLATALFVDNSQEGTFTARVLDAASGTRLNTVSSLFNDTTGYFDPGQIFGPKAFNRTGLVNAYDDNYYVPYTGSWSLRIQRQLMRNTVITAAYVGNKATGLPRGPNLNQVEIRDNGFLTGFLAARRNIAASGDPLNGEATGVFGQIWNVMSAADRNAQLTTIRDGNVATLADFIDRARATSRYLETAGLPLTFFRLNPQFQNSVLLGNHSNSTWNGLKLGVTRRFDQGLQFDVNYTFGKGLTDYEGGQSQRDSYRDNENPGLDKGLTSIDSTHVINANFLWELPVGRGRRWLSASHPITNGFLGGWQLNGIFNYSSGLPFTITSSRNKLTIDDTSNADCAGCSPDLTTKVIRGDTIRALTTDEVRLFTDPAPGSAGYTAPRFFRGSGLWVFDASVFKDFPLSQLLGEQGKIQTRFEFFNAFNHVNFAAPNSSLTSGQLGVISATQGGTNPRIIQVALKVLF